jgi:hypothetical protein
MADKEKPAWPGPTSPPPDDEADAKAWPGPTAPDPATGGDPTQAWPGPTAPDDDDAA